MDLRSRLLAPLLTVVFALAFWLVVEYSMPPEPAMLTEFKLHCEGHAPSTIQCTIHPTTTTEGN